MAKKVTLEDLAAMTGRGFGEMGKKLNGLDQKVTSLDEKVAKLDKKVDRNHAEILFKLTEIVHRDEFLSLEQRVRRMEAKLGLSS